MLIELQTALTCLASFPHAMDQDERLQYFSWSGCLIVGIVYSFFLFFDEVPKDHREIFSKRNKRSLTQILKIHTAFVTLLLCALRICSYVVRYLPFWMTHEIDLGEGYFSIADVIFVIGAMALFAYEREWLVIAMDGSESVQE
jgi:Zn-dependent protease